MRTGLNGHVCSRGHRGPGIAWGSQAIPSLGSLGAISQQRRGYGKPDRRSVQCTRYWGAAVGQSSVGDTANLIVAAHDIPAFPPRTATPQILGRHLESTLSRADSIKASWGDSFMSVEHLLLAVAEDRDRGVGKLLQVWKCGAELL
eukprot:354968-Chlamydomonas_euryale.AAC.4